MCCAGRPRSPLSARRRRVHSGSSPTAASRAAAPRRPARDRRPTRPSSSPRASAGAEAGTPPRPSPPSRDAAALARRRSALTDVLHDLHRLRHDGGPPTPDDAPPLLPPLVAAWSNPRRHDARRSARSPVPGMRSAPGIGVTGSLRFRSRLRGAASALSSSIPAAKSSSCFRRSSTTPRDRFAVLHEARPRHRRRQPAGRPLSRRRRGPPPPHVAPRDRSAPTDQRRYCSRPRVPHAHVASSSLASSTTSSATPTSRRRRV